MSFLIFQCLPASRANIFGLCRWQKDETSMGTRRVRRELQNEKRKVKWKEFVRDQRGLCGVRWLTKKVLTFIFFGFIIA